MKSYDETVRSVLEKIELKKEKAQKTKKILLRTLSPALALGMVLLISLANPRLWDRTTPPPSETIGDSVTPGEPDYISPDRLSEDSLPATDTKAPAFTVNTIASYSSASPLYLDPDDHYTESWDSRKIADYLGWAPETLGNDYLSEGPAFVCVTYSLDGTLVRDTMSFSYSLDGSRITLSASRISPPYDCIYVLESENKTTLRVEDKVSEVLFFADPHKEGEHEDYSLMIADFESGGVYYRLRAEDVTVDDFFNTVVSILNKAS